MTTSSEHTWSWHKIRSRIVTIGACCFVAALIYMMLTGQFSAR